MASRSAQGDVVVLVDPREKLLTWLEDALRREQFDIVHVESAEVCLQRLDRDDVDAVLSSYSLNGLNGLQLLRSIRVSRPALPFVLAPSEGSEKLAGDAFAASANGYVPRDTGAATVVSRLRQVIQRARVEYDDEQFHRYRHLVEISPAPINVFDENGETIWGNDAVLELLGLHSLDDLLGRSIFEFIHPDDREVARSELETVIERRESVGPTEMKLLRDDGEVRYVMVSTAVGEFLGANIGQAIVIDMSEQYERNRQLEILDNWLRHNIRNDMSVIMGLAESITSDLVVDEKATAEKIFSRARHLVDQAEFERRLIHLLTQQGDPVAMEVLSAVQDQVAKYRDQYPDADIEISRMDEFEVNVHREFSDAVGELIANAIQHSDQSEPSVSITIRQAAQQNCEIRIADTGPGIPAAEREAIPLDGELNQISHNSGMGLVFVYWVVRLAGGSMTFADNEPRGTVVTLTVPRALDTAY